MGLLLKIGEDYISKFSKPHISKIFESFEFDVLDIQGKMRLMDSPKISFHEWTATLSIPVEIDLLKNDGLFSQTTHGAVWINCPIKISKVEEIWRYEVSLSNYQWQSPPKDLDTDLPIETPKMIGLIINHIGPILTAKIHETILELPKYIKAELNETTEKIKNLLSGIPMIDEFEIGFPEGILWQVEKSKWGKHDLNFEVISDFSITADGRNPNTIQHSLTTLEEEIKSAAPMLGTITLKPQHLENLVKNMVDELEFGGQKVTLEDIKINFLNGINLTTKLKDPIEAKVEARIKPLLDVENQVLKLDSHSITITPDSFFHKLTAPVIQKLLEGYVSKYFPFALSTYSSIFESQLLEHLHFQFPEAGISFHQIKFSKLYIQNEELHVDLEIEELKIEL